MESGACAIEQSHVMVLSKVLLPDSSPSDGIGLGDSNVAADS